MRQRSQVTRSHFTSTGPVPGSPQPARLNTPIASNNGMTNQPSQRKPGCNQRGQRLPLGLVIASPPG